MRCLRVLFWFGWCSVVVNCLTFGLDIVSGCWVYCGCWCSLLLEYFCFWGSGAGCLVSVVYDCGFPRDC